MNYFDTHVHLWDIKNQINSWVAKSNDPNLQQNRLLKDYITENPNTSHIFTIEASDNDKTLAEVRWISSQAKDLAHQVLVYHFAYIDLLQEPKLFAIKLQQFKQFEFVIGFRSIFSHSMASNYSPCIEDFTLNQAKLHRLQANLSILKKYGYIFNCQMYPQQLLRASQYIAESQVTCLIDHCALPLVRCKNTMQAWLEVLKVYNNINAYLKLSGLDLNETYNSCDMIFENIFDSIPWRKLVFGTNYPVGVGVNSSKVLLEFLGNNLLNNIAENIFFTNAKELVDS